MAIAKQPRTGRTWPSSPSSPRKTREASSSRMVHWSEANSTPSATGKSKPVPSLRKSPGARLTTMRRLGTEKPEFLSAESTRSRLSRTAPSGSPTREKPGSPNPASHSMRTGTAESPTRVADCKVAIIANLSKRPRPPSREPWPCWGFKRRGQWSGGSFPAPALGWHQPGSGRWGGRRRSTGRCRPSSR